MNDRAMDLAVVAAIISSYKNSVIKENKVYFGEVSLTGNVNHVTSESIRFKETKRLGYSSVNSDTLSGDVRKLSV